MGRKFYTNATGSASSASSASWSSSIAPKHKSLPSPSRPPHSAGVVTKPPFTSLLSKLRSFHKCSRSSPPAVALAIPSPVGNDARPAWMRDGKLDPAIWRKLPDDLLEHILGFLPFPNVFRCATVSHQFSALCRSSRIGLTGAWPTYSPIRYTHTPDGHLRWSGFAIDSNKWQPMPEIPITGKGILLTGAAGLLAIYRPGGTVVVINPVTNQRRELPLPNQKWLCPDVLHMVAESGHYKIIIAGTKAYSRRKSQATEVYDSVTRKWSVMGGLRDEVFLDTQDAAVDREGRILCTAQESSGDSLVAFDVRRGVWAEVASDLPNDAARQSPLVTSAGRVLMAVAPVDDDGPVGCLYELRERRWELVTSMPESLHRRVRNWGACVVSGEHVVVVSDTAVACCVVSYDLSRGTWSERRERVKVTRRRDDERLLAPVSFRPDVHCSP